MIDAISTIGDKIIEFLAESNPVTHFIYRVWVTVETLFEYLGSFLNTGINAVHDFFWMLSHLFGYLTLTTVLIPPFILPWIVLFVSIGLSALALSIILELL